MPLRLNCVDCRRSISCFAVEALEGCGQIGGGRSRIFCIEAALIGHCRPDGDPPEAFVGDAASAFSVEDVESQGYGEGFADAIFFIQAHGIIAAVVMHQGPEGGDMAAVFKRAVADELAIEAAFVGEIDLFRHEPVEARAYGGAVFVQMEGERGLLGSCRERGEDGGEGHVQANRHKRLFFVCGWGPVLAE